MASRFPVARAAALVLSGAVAVSQQPAAPPQPTFRTEANYIRVDAFVTRDGEPVHGLTPGDFELLEDGVPQKIDAFEHVVIRPAGPQRARIEPNSQQDANQMAADPRARIFVVFLDVDHVPVEGSFRLKSALATMLSQMLGEDDMVGVITSRHSPSELILARKTALIEEQLEKYWYWGRKDTLLESPDETMYRQCFEGYPGGREVAEEMIDRRREKLSLDALTDLTMHLRGLREERKAVLVVSAGWPLFRENASLARPLTSASGGRVQMPSPPPIGVGPGGRIMSGDDPRSPTATTLCERHRWELAFQDDWRAFQDLMADANRANVSFYPIDPRGLVVFDSPLGPRPPRSLSTDLAMLRARETSLRTLAENTDGLAVVAMNNLAAGMKKITADLTSYYLLGYYSSNAALDGKYRQITVRVKRPGVEVRARKGYRAATREEVSRAAAAAESPSAGAAEAMRGPVAAALSRLALIRPDAGIFVHATHRAGTPLWVAVEIPGAAARAAAWARGGRVSLLALDAAGNTVGAARKTLAAGERAVLMAVPIDAGAAAPAEIQVRAEPEGAAPIGLEVKPGQGEPLLLRRSGAADPQAAADFRFYRTEHLVYRWALDGNEAPVSARVLDRTGAPMALSSAPAAETISGARWMTGTLPLAPLVNGDYLLELTRKDGAGQETRALLPFRIVR